MCIKTALAKDTTCLELHMDPCLWPSIDWLPSLWILQLFKQQNLGHEILGDSPHWHCAYIQNTHDKLCRKNTIQPLKLCKTVRQDEINKKRWIILSLYKHTERVLQKVFAFWSFTKSMESHAHFPFCTKIQKNSQLQYIGKFCFSRFATSAPLSHDLGESVGRMLRKLGTN